MFYSDVFYSDVFYSDVFYSDVFYSDVFYGDVFYSDVFYGDVFYGDVFYGHRFLSTLSAVANPLRKSLPDPCHSLRADRAHPSLQHSIFHDCKAAYPNHARHLQARTGKILIVFLDKLVESVDSLVHLEEIIQISQSS